MPTIPLGENAVSTLIDAKIAAQDAAEAASYAKVFSGTGAATGVQMEKIGDIYVKTDTAAVYVAKSTTKSSGWVLVSAP